jgi:hypothetical protein
MDEADDTLVGSLKWQKRSDIKKHPVAVSGSWVYRGTNELFQKTF